MFLIGSQDFKMSRSYYVFKLFKKFKSVDGFKFPFNSRLGNSIYDLILNKVNQAENLYEGQTPQESNQKNSSSNITPIPQLTNTLINTVMPTDTPTSSATNTPTETITTSSTNTAYLTPLTKTTSSPTNTYSPTETITSTNLTSINPLIHNTSLPTVTSTPITNPV